MTFVVKDFFATSAQGLFVFFPPRDFIPLCFSSPLVALFVFIPPRFAFWGTRQGYPSIFVFITNIHHCQQPTVLPQPRPITYLQVIFATVNNLFPFYWGAGWKQPTATTALQPQPTLTISRKKKQLQYVIIVTKSIVCQYIGCGNKRFVLYCIDYSTPACPECNNQNYFCLSLFSMLITFNNPY